MAEARRFYVIFNNRTEEIETTYGTTTMPALYVSHGVAFGVLKKRRALYGYEGREVREVELTIL